MSSDKSPSSDSKAASEKARILVIEDDPRTVDLIRYRLLNAGYEVQIAFDGVAGLQRFHDQPPHLVLTDMLLPHKDGFEVCDEIKTDPDPAIAEIPVVMMSAVYRDKEDRLRARLHRRRAAPDVLLEKPLRFDELLRHLRRLVGPIDSESALIDEPMGSESETVLIVDDDPRGRHMVSLALRGRGYRIVQAEDGEEALEILQREEVALLLTDVQMPGMSGLDLLRELRDRRRDLMVIVMTAYGSEEVAVEAMKLGANDYLTKPIDTRELLVVVRENIEKQRLAKERARLVEQLRETSHDLVTRIDILERQNQILETSRQALQQARETQVAFVSTISHELRTPLTVIKGGLAMVIDARDRLSDDQRDDLLERARSQTERMIHLTNEFLDLERIESGRTSFDPVVIDLVDLVRKTCEALQPAAEQKEMEILFDAPKRAAGAEADREALVRILNNLLGNAIKYAPAGGRIEVAIRLQAPARRKAEWRLEVKDRGPGVKDDLKERIFERFIRQETNASAGVASTGLGLSIVRSLARLHGGEAGVEDRPGGGSIFWFTLPQKTPPPTVRPPKTVVCVGLHRNDTIELAALLGEHGIELDWYEEPTAFLGQPPVDVDRFVLDLDSAATSQSLFLMLKWVEKENPLPVHLLPVEGLDREQGNDDEPGRLFSFVHRFQQRPNMAALAEKLILG